MSYSDMDTEGFKEAFWQWFDNLPKEERLKFKEYPADMAELYFYNKIWSPSSTEQSTALRTQRLGV